MREAAEQAMRLEREARQEVERRMRLLEEEACRLEAERQRAVREAEEARRIAFEDSSLVQAELRKVQSELENSRQITALREHGESAKNIEANEISARRIQKFFRQHLQKIRVTKTIAVTRIQRFFRHLKLRRIFQSNLREHLQCKRRFAKAHAVILRCWRAHVTHLLQIRAVGKISKWFLAFKPLIRARVLWRGFHRLQVTVEFRS